MTCRAARVEPAAGRRVRRGRAGCRGCRSAGPAGRGWTGTRRAGPGCTGAAGCRRPCGSAPDSTTWPAYITSSRSEKWLTSDMSWVTKMTAKPSSLLQLLDLHHQRALRDHVERRGRLVHDHQVGREQQRHRDHRALPHAAAELVRIAASGGQGRCRPARSTSSDRSLIVAGERSPCAFRASLNCAPIDVTGLKRVHRALHDDRQVSPAQRVELFLGQRRPGSCP